MSALEINKIYEGDCVQVMSIFPADIIDLTVTSPPYEKLRNYKHSIPFDYKKTAQELYRITKRGGICVWVVADQTIDGSESGESFRQALYFKEAGWTLHDTMIYQKQGLNFTPKNKYYQMFEYMFVFSKGPPETFNPIQVPRTGHQYGSVGTVKRGTKKKIAYDPTKPTRNAGNIWIIPNHSKNATKDEIAYEHPAIFPEKLANDHILSWSNEGDLVFDPMCGSGTTLKMAKKLNRNYLGIEANPDYIKIAEERLK